MSYADTFLSPASLDVVGQGCGLNRLRGVLATLGTLRNIQEATRSPHYDSFSIHKTMFLMDDANHHQELRTLSDGDYVELRYRMGDIKSFPLRIADDLSDTSSRLSAGV
jgi:hypothetical protein